MTKLTLETLSIKQLGEHLIKLSDEVWESAPRETLHEELHKIGEMLKDYKFGILVGLSFDEGAHVTAVATIETPYELAHWDWNNDEGRRETGTAYRDAKIEETLEEQANMLGDLDEDEDEDDE